MFRKILPLLVALMGLAGLAPAASASDFFAFGRPDDGTRVWKPYVIEKNCTDDYYHCRVRMDYAPHQRAMVVRPGSYWYQKPFQIYRYGDFEHNHHHRHAYKHGVSRHVAWCEGRYRSYNPATDTFTGKSGRHYRCNSPYDGR
jgi:hypothetical protein